MPVLLLLLAHLAGVSVPTPLPPLPPGYVLSEFIRHYEPAVFDQEETLRTHHRLRRSTNSHAEPLRIHFSTQHRDFRLKLYPDRGVFSDDVSFVTGSGRPLDFDPGAAYHGTLEDDERAVVRGVLTGEGLFDGTIDLASGEEYFVEPVSRYRRDCLGFHSVVYRGEDVAPPPRGCPSLLRGPPSPLPLSPGPPPPSHLNKTTCMLYLQADHLFYQKYATEEACIEVMTRHVQRVNSIYKTTDFNQDGRPDNISFMIKRIKVHTTDSLYDPSYRFPGNYGVEKFLELFSEEDYDAFCLAYMFTYRDFEMGTLGLAWTGDLKNAGGVCEKNGHYRGSMKSLNTGIVTLLNYGKHVPPAVSHVTLAHEIGHNFGSPHDPEVCTPGGEDGNFIMFARATSGDKKNNNKFSRCSLNSINPVLNTKARSAKGCFTEPQVGICGNGVVEEGEQCDCGWEEDCKEDCCYPQRRNPPPDQPPCHLTPHSLCSPSQGPCCTPECKLKFSDKCRDDNGCRDSSYCDGRGPHCPPSINKPNKTICNDEFVCFMGECTGSICLAYGLESCQCIPGPGDPSTKACELCCKLPGENQPCLSSFYWNTTNYEMPILYSKPGTPCNDYNGYCDVFQKCREVDPSGPLATLRKLLLSEQSIASFKRWVMDRWYYALLIVASLILILVLSTRLLGKTTELKLKGITIVHSSGTPAGATTEEAAAGGGTAGNVVVHPGVSSKVPLRRRVRRVNKKKRPPKAKKEVAVGVAAAEEDPLGKVRQWLMASDVQRRTQGVRKSKSSPAGFPTTVPPPRSRHPRANLQVVYKPPFKFSVRLRKPAQVATTVVKEINQKVRRPQQRIGVVQQTGDAHKKKRKPPAAKPPEPPPPEPLYENVKPPEQGDTVPSDLEVLLSESEYLFSET